MSSTFSDLIAERNALQAEVFPRLRDYCERRGARFQAIDLRWGVSEEAALDQQTMAICLDEIARCREVSPRPNFIVLLGDRYGWRPLPAQIPADEFEAILACAPSSRHSLLTTGESAPAWRAGMSASRHGWYRKDLNAAPPHYVLQPRTIDFPPGISATDKQRILQQEAKDWRRCEAEIHALFSSAMDELAWAKDDPRRQRYERSAIHQEIEAGALHPSLDSDNHVFAYYREIAGDPPSGPATAFIDRGEARQSLAALKQKLEQRLAREHIHRYTARWKGDHPEADLDALCRRVYEDLRGIIDAELRDFQRRPDLEREREAHREFARERSQHFVGRTDLLERIGSYLEDPHDNRPLVLHGVSGCGKTALMACAWLRLSDPEQAVARFIGATPGSADLRTLLRSVCEQLGIRTPPTGMNDLVTAFRERLAGAQEGGASAFAPGRTIVFLDAIDQLNPADNARMLYWLPRTLAPGVKLVLSVLEPEPDKVQGAGRDDPFDIARRIWPDHLSKVGTLPAAEGHALLRTWLAGAGRTLQEGQLRDILDKSAANWRPLYLKVAFEEARNWHSWEGLPGGAGAVPGLSSTIEGILADMLHRLERPRYHGRLLLEHALGSLAAARNGLTEDELVDILSAEKTVMDDTLDRNPQSPEIDRLPVVIWSRLRADLKPYIAERRADGTIVMTFYHRQVADAVRARYLAGPGARLRAHVLLGDYFHRLDYWAESLEAQRERAGRLPPAPRPANVRKVVELPYHRLEAAKLGGNDDPNSPYWAAVADLLTDWHFLEAKAEADPYLHQSPASEPPPARDGGKP